MFDSLISPRVIEVAVHWLKLHLTPTSQQLGDHLLTKSAGGFGSSYFPGRQMFLSFYIVMLCKDNCSDKEEQIADVSVPRMSCPNDLRSGCVSWAGVCQRVAFRPQAACESIIVWSRKSKFPKGRFRLFLSYVVGSRHSGHGDQFTSRCTIQLSS